MFEMNDKCGREKRLVGRGMVGVGGVLASKLRKMLV